MTDLTMWLIARTPRWRSYPCKCVLGRPCGYRCDCAGRTDVDVMPAHCCARRTSETKARNA